MNEPIARYLDRNREWQGIGGEYTIHLGEDCAASSGHTTGLPLMSCNTSGISRLWIRAASANKLATSGEISAEQSLLDTTLSLPEPHPGWEF